MNNIINAQFKLLLLLAGVGMVFRPGVARAHTGPPPTPEQIWSAWNGDPLLIAGLALLGGGYGLGLTRLWQRAGIGRGVRQWQALAFAGGMLALGVALISPLDALGHALFAAHMVQHLLLILVAAPLLLIGRPLVPLVWALPRAWRPYPERWWRRSRVLPVLWQWLSHPLPAWLLHALAVWFWHVPQFYEEAIAVPWVHVVEHLCFLGTALLFWWVVLHPAPRRRLGYGAGVLYVFTMGLQGGILGALMTFTGRPWYSAHVSSNVVWRVLHPEERRQDGVFICTPVDPQLLQQALLEDQQLAGLIMWVPAGVVYLIAALALLYAWLAAAEQRQRLAVKL